MLYQILAKNKQPTFFYVHFRSKYFFVNIVNRFFTVVNTVNVVNK